MEQNNDVSNISSDGGISILNGAQGPILRSAIIDPVNGVEIEGPLSGQDIAALQALAQIPRGSINILNHSAGADLTGARINPVNGFRYTYRRRPSTPEAPIEIPPEIQVATPEPQQMDTDSGAAVALPAGAAALPNTFTDDPARKPNALDQIFHFRRPHKTADSDLENKDDAYK